MAVEEIGADALGERIEAGHPASLLDVRESHERSFCAIDAPGLHVPMNEVPEHLAEIAATVPPRAHAVLVLDAPVGIVATAWWCPRTSPC